MKSNREWLNRSAPIRYAAVGVLLFAVAAGLWFRFAAIDRKYFWLDEVHAALLRSGHSEYDLLPLFDDQPRPLIEMQRYAEIDPAQPFMKTAEALAMNHPVHPPFYYLLLRAWTEVAGPSIAATRALSAVLSLLCFPAVYWLTKELFRSRTAAWTAVALWSLSPFEVLYAQEAKQYSLFAATLMLSGAALLRALRLRTTGSWALYAVATAVALYTHMLFAPVLGAFVLFVFLANVGRLRQPRTWKLFGGFAAATTAALLMFSPWIVYCLNIGEEAGRHIVTKHMSDPQSLAWLAGAWISNIGCAFFDPGPPETTAGFWVRVVGWLGVIGLTVYSFRRLKRARLPTAWLFLALVVVIPPLTLIAPDMVLGGGRSMLARYWLATSIGVLLVVTGALNLQFSAPQRSQRWFAGAAAMALLAAGFVSCYRSEHSDYWWNKAGVVNNHRKGALEFDNMRLALATIENSERPLIITELGHYQECRMLSFTYYLNDPKVEWLGTLDPSMLKVPEDRTVYLYVAHATYKHLLKQGWEFEAVEPSAAFVLAKRGPTADVSKFVEAGESNPVPAAADLGSQ